MRLTPAVSVGAIYDRFGEGFRAPAIVGRPCRDGPAYGNRPSTNPRGHRCDVMGI
jgi:hypothetical protein